MSTVKSNRLYGSSICWFCANAVPSESTGCNWSRDLKPVDGWEARVSETKWATQWDETVYHVIKCPEFIKG